MARLPGNMELRLPQVVGGVTQIRNAGAVGQAVERFGAGVNVMGEAILEREATASAKERDVVVSDRIRALLYDPENGFTNMQGQNAVAARERTIAELDALTASATEGLNRSAARKLETSLLSRIERAKMTVDGHVGTQRDAWLSGASEARVVAAYQDGLANPREIDAALAVIESEIEARATREGWAPEKLQVEVAGARSKLHTETARKMAALDPVGALEYVRSNQDRMVASDVADMERVLAPEVKRALGRSLGASAYNRANVTTDAQAAMATLEKMAGQTFTVTSAYRDPGHNAAVGGAKGSQHTHGNAFDIDVRGMTKEERAALIRQARAAGFGGVGVYANSLHFDVGPTRHWGPDYLSGSLPEWALGAVAAARGTATEAGGNPLMEIAGLADPDVQQAALAEFELLAAIDEGERKAAKQAAVSAALQNIESGGSLNDLAPEDRAAMGTEALSALQSRETTLRRGLPVETDPARYYELRRMAANDPAAFRALDLSGDVARLSASDWQGLVDMQTKPASDVTTAAASTLMEVASRHIRSAGIKTTETASAGDKAKVAVIQTRLLQWQDGFVRDQGRAPTQTEINAQVSRELLPVVINPPGIGNEVDTNIFGLEGVDLSAAQLSVSGTSITIGGQEIPRGLVDDAVRGLIRQGLPVTADNLVTVLMAVVR